MGAIETKTRRKWFHHAKGITYFDRTTERNFFLILTFLAIFYGLLVRWDIL